MELKQLALRHAEIIESWGEFAVGAELVRGLARSSSGRPRKVTSMLAVRTFTISITNPHPHFCNGIPWGSTHRIGAPDGTVSAVVCACGIGHEYYHIAKNFVEYLKGSGTDV
jgi:hypothetical protein